MGVPKRSWKKTSRFFEEAADKLRRRKTEKPHLVGWMKKSQVVVGPVQEKIVKDQKVFFANFVPPRKGSQLSPLYRDHHIVLAFEAAIHQVAIASLKREGLRGVEMLVAKNSFTWRKKIGVGQNVVVEVRPSEKRKTQNFELRDFKCRIVDPQNARKALANGQITIVIIPKKNKK